MVATLLLIKLSGKRPEKRYKWEPIRDDVELGNAAYPMVLVQIPMYNEGEVYRFSIGAACGLSWPSDRIIVQVLDDSTDPVIQVQIPPSIGGLVGWLRNKDDRVCLSLFFWSRAWWRWSARGGRARAWISGTRRGRIGKGTRRGRSRSGCGTTTSSSAITWPSSTPTSGPSPTSSGAPSRSSPSTPRSPSSRPAGSLVSRFLFF